MMCPHIGSYIAPSLPHARGFPPLRVLSKGPTSTDSSNILWFSYSDCYTLILERSLWISQVPVISISVVPCTQTPPMSPNISPLAMFDVVFQRFESVDHWLLFLRGSIASLALRPKFALSTLNSCRYLLESKTRSRMRRLYLLSAQEFHLLEMPSLLGAPMPSLMSIAC